MRSNTRERERERISESRRERCIYEEYLCVCCCRKTGRECGTTATIMPESNRPGQVRDAFIVVCDGNNKASYKQAKFMLVDIYSRIFGQIGKEFQKTLPCPVLFLVNKCDLAQQVKQDRVLALKNTFFGLETATVCHSFFFVLFYSFLFCLFFFRPCTLR
eukprot:gnl/Spiro4/22833_TR11259_c0_g1_i1.p1 gnl/Spiro4/22833_TR11259_c0_g1~~gnl/Spiro4/22833_TR11259_c0_g1_i1.p1  ORF type:complete len:160 (+),score=9.32 gnl/Spiro4/22833_TR11259_c0_g1_i1:96-575(+)